MGDIKYGNFKMDVLLASEHQSDQKENVTNDFRIKFRYVFAHAKRRCQLNTRKCSFMEDFNQNGSLSIS